MKIQFFQSKYFSYLIGITAIQQLMVAGSSYYLIKLSENISNGIMNWNYLLLFLGCLVLVYIPVSLQKIVSELWNVDLQKKYIDLFIQSHRGRIEYLGDDKVQNEKSGYLQREAAHVIDQVVFYWLDLSTTALNVLFNVFVITVLLDKKFIFAYAASAVIFYTVNILSTRYISKLSNDTQEKRVNFTGILNYLWGNLLIANKAHLNALTNDINASLLSLRRTTLLNNSKHEGVQMLLTFLAMSPIILFIIYLFYTNQSQVAILVPLAVSLHRQIQTVQHIEVLGSLSLRAHTIKGVVTGLETSLAALPENILSSRINESKIVFKQNGNRILITGSNGAGKSSWLKLKKTEHGDSGIYVPANMDVYLGEQSSYKSSGQKARYMLESLLKLANAPKQTILLDEWDANLDQENSESLNQLVSELSKAHTVYEVRHV